MHHRSFGLCLALMLTAMAGRAVADCKLQRFARLPVTMAGTRPLITGSINGVTVQFLADSGSFFNMISRETAERLQLHSDPLPPGFLVWGIGGAALPTVATVKDFTLAGLGTQTFHNVEFIEIGNFFGTEEAGVIGQNLLGHADSEYDLANGTIGLFYAKDCRGKSLAYWQATGPVAAMDIERTSPSSPHLIGTVKLNGAKIKVMFDSGASYSILSLKAAARAGIKPDSPGVVSGGVSRGIGRNRVQTWLAWFNELDLGGEQIKNARLRIADIDLPGADMLLGVDFFLSHRLYIAHSLQRMFFTYNGGHVFDLTVTKSDNGSAPASADQPADAPAQAAQPAPTDAAGYRRRGAAAAARHDLRSAIADMDQAVRLDPADADNYYQRALVRWQDDQPVLAMADFDQTLKLRPDDIAAHMERGALHLAAADAAGADADFAAVDTLAPHDPAIALRIAQDYDRTGHFDEALARYDRWIAANPRDERMPGALNGRCWSRAMINQDLALALEDCNGALKGGRRYEVLDSRGFVWLRLREFDKSIADYTASLALQPKNAWSSYGLGLAESGKGMKEQADKDMQLAITELPSIADDFKRVGLAP